MSSTKTLKAILSVTLHLTEVCNLRCKMCYFWGESGTYTKLKGKPKVLDFGIVKRLIRELVDAGAKPYYSLFGGEPLTYPHLEELIRVIKDTGAFVDTPTNGTFLTDKAEMLVRTGFDQVRISLDGPQEINDYQRGKGCYQKAIDGINDLSNEKKKVNSNTPRIGILYTITKDNYRVIEEFFLNNPDLDLDAVGYVGLQMQNFIIQEMGEQFESFLKTEMGILTEKKWCGFVRNIEEFNDIDISILCNQVNNVCSELENRNIRYSFHPPTCSPENISAYLKADWQNMVDLYETCPAPWSGVEIIASGEVVPCHIFHDFVLGNLKEKSFTDIWFGEKYARLRNYIKKNKFMPICNIGCCVLYIAGIKR
ncbi:MAG: radical SAM/SPASM domain-containing protein [Promethearchaeota archaeon]